MKKRAPHVAGLFVSRPTISSSCWVAWLNRKRCSVAPTLQTPDARFERSSGASLTLCSGPSPSRLPSPLLCLESPQRFRLHTKEQVACLRHGGQLETTV